jgi:phosphatidylserine decarboxylase
MAVMAINALTFAFAGSQSVLSWIILIFSLTHLFLTFYFFRIPTRDVLETNSNTLICPADGKVVVIEKVFDEEFFKAERIQVSIFMSPLNVHINWYPMPGQVAYEKYHPGKYLVAWHPKSSTENERQSVVIENNGKQILVKQIAGALAKRIVCYAETGTAVSGGQELGFIKFGSRVDVLLPLDADIQVQLGQHVSGLQTILAKI